MHGLHRLRQSNGHAVVVKARDACYRIGREGEIPVFRLVDVVVGLLGRGPGEIRCCGRSILGCRDMEHSVSAGAVRIVEAWRALAFHGPMFLLRSFERNLVEHHGFWSADVHTNAEIRAGSHLCCCRLRRRREAAARTGIEFDPAGAAPRCDKRGHLDAKRLSQAHRSFAAA